VRIITGNIWRRNNKEVTDMFCSVHRSPFKDKSPGWKEAEQQREAESAYQNAFLIAVHGLGFRTKFQELQASFLSKIAKSERPSLVKVETTESDVGDNFCSCDAVKLTISPRPIRYGVAD
jgi:hypothetical protein